MNQIQEKKRPPVLTYLCLGSIIFGSFWLIMLITLMLFSLRGDVQEAYFPGLVIEYLGAGYTFLTVFMALITLGLASVILMWQKKNTGFYIYTASKTVFYFFPVAFIGSNHLTFTGLVFTAMGITAYGVFFIKQPPASKKTKK